MPGRPDKISTRGVADVLQGRDLRSTGGTARERQKGQFRLGTSPGQSERRELLHLSEAELHEVLHVVVRRVCNRVKEYDMAPRNAADPCRLESHM